MPFVGFEGTGDGGAALDPGTELRERQLDSRERGRDVEDVEPADVADPEDLALQRALSRRERDAVPVAQMPQQLVAVDALGARIAVTTAELSSSGEKSSRPIALMPARAARPRRTWRSNAALEAVVEHQAERDVEAPDQRDRRCERRVQLVLRRLVRPPVEVEAARLLARASTCSGTDTVARPGGHISAFCEPETATSIPHTSVSSGTAPSDEIASTTSSRVADRLLDRLDVGHDARRGVGLLAEHEVDAGLA